MSGNFVYECTYTDDDIGMEYKLFANMEIAKDHLQVSLIRFDIDYDADEYIFAGKVVFAKREVHNN